MTGTVRVVGERRRWVSAADAAASARRALEEGDEDWAFRLIAQARDHLRRLSDPADVALWAEEPPSTGDRRFDVLLSAVAARTFLELGVKAVPGWAADVEPLSQPWYPAELPSLRRRADRETPPDLRRLGLMLTENDLTTA